MRNPDILKQTNFQSRIIPIDFAGYPERTMLAGCPVNAKGQFANDGSAIGILVEDVTRDYAYGEIAVAGFVDYEIAQNHAGISYTKECMTALKNIVFEGVGDKWIESGGEVTSWNDLTDRPFGDMVGRIYFVPETTFAGQRVTGETDPMPIYARDNVFVELDGKPYECAVETDVHGYVNVYLDIKGPDEMFVFSMAFLDGDDIANYAFTVNDSADDTEHTFSIYIIGEYTKILDEKFLPETAFTKSAFTANVLDNGALYLENQNGVFMIFEAEITKDFNAALRRAQFAYLPLATTIGEDAFSSSDAHIKLNPLLVTSVGKYAFSHNSSLETVDFPLLTSVGSYAFWRCSNLTTANLPAVTIIDSSTFNECTSLTTVNLPAAIRILGSAFAQCYALTTLDLPSVTYIGGQPFYASGLTTLILRAETVCESSKAYPLTSTPIDDQEGYIYVPSALVDSYKAATNWSTYASQFRALEDYTVDGTITGELDETKINATA